MRKFITTASVLIVSVGIATGQAQAVPEPDAGTVNYTAQVKDGATVISTDAGSMVVEDGALKIKSASGQVLAGTELSFRVDDFVFPIAAAVSGRTAELRPQFDLEHATYRPVSLPFENQAPFRNEFDREQTAFGRLVATVNLGAVLGATVGTLGGAAVGCVLGGIAGATVAAASLIGLFGPFIPAGVIGCLGGALTAGALGAIAGQLFVTAPIAVMAAIQYFTTINAPAPAPAN